MHRLLILRIAAVALLVIGGYVALGSLRGRNDQAETLVAPRVDLAPPYDFAGVRDALGERATILSVPTPEEVGHAHVSPDAFLVRLPTTVTQSYPGERVQVVSVHLAVVDATDPHIEVTHRLSYVVETTGHATGNCFTLYDASTGEQYLAACFYSGRSRP
jgi:hypothetical protein